MAEAISLPFEARLKLSDKPPHVMLEHFHAGYALQLVINASYQLFVREENYAVSARELVLSMSIIFTSLSTIKMLRASAI